MYDTEKRMTMVERRVTMLLRKKVKRQIQMMSILCFTLAGSLVWLTGALTDGGKGHVPMLYGSTMLLEDTGGYVLTGVLSFSAAVVITVLCIRHRSIKSKK